MPIDETLAHTFGHQVRVRVCGICVQRNQILLVCHKGMGVPELWMPPGGGLAFGEPAAEALRREMREETGLHVAVGALRFVYEVHNGPFHAIELFFETTILQGDLALGQDPELAADQQSLAQVAWADFSNINTWPNAHKHALFQHCRNTEELLGMHGFYFHRVEH